LRSIGLQTPYSTLESAEDLGGTWRTNKYTGVAVDIPSFVYQFSFEPNYRWSRSFAEGDEINDYLHHCASKYDIKKHIHSTYELAMFYTSKKDDKEGASAFLEKRQAEFTAKTSSD